MATTVYTTVSNGITTTISEFGSSCSVTSAVPTPISSGTWTSTYTHGTQVTLSIFHGEYMIDSCSSYLTCQPDSVEPNPDIAGLGIILAFLITAWAAFVFLVIAYFGRLLPPDHIRRADRACFFVGSDNCEDKWKETLDKVILIFSDQQLITGLTILIAGYCESFYQNLAAHHWQIVVFLGWMSSTVHLISLTLLRPWLNKNLLIRNLRLFGMITLLALLAVALYPSATDLYLLGVESVNNFPIKCFWNQDWIAQTTSRYRHSHMSINDTFISNLAADGDIIPNMATNDDAIISYVTLFAGYIWKIAQLLDGKNNRLRRYTIIPPIVKLERLAKSNADFAPKRWTARWAWLKLIIYAYVLVMVITEAVDSFMATLLFLLATLSWGTIQIFLTRSWAEPSVLDAEKVFSFGQLLPLLLLVQPLYAIVEHFAKSADEYQPVHPPPQPPHCISPSRSPSPEPAMRKQNTMKIIANETEPSCLTLSEVLRTCTLLTAEQKADGVDHDPVRTHLYKSKVFKFMIWCTYLIPSSITMSSFTMITWIGLSDGESVDMRLSVIESGVPLAIVIFLCALTFSLPCSKKLH